MVEFVCIKCNYRHSVKVGKPMPTRCGYCDSRGSLRRVQSAQDLLNEVSFDVQDKATRNE